MKDHIMLNTADLPSATKIVTPLRPIGQLLTNIKHKHHQQGARASVLGKAGSTHLPSFCTLPSAYMKLYSNAPEDRRRYIRGGTHIERTIILITLDFTADFDTIYHFILPSRLASSFAITDPALS